MTDVANKQYYSFQEVIQRIKCLHMTIMEMLRMSVEVSVQGIEKGEKEIAAIPTGNRLLNQLNSMQTQETHIVKLLVQSGNDLSFLFIHEAFPIVSYEDSQNQAHTALLNFAVALQARLQHPIK